MGHPEYLETRMARRRKSSTIDDLLSISLKLPLWANLVVAAGSFAVLRYYGGSEFPEMAPVAADQLADSLATHFVTLAAYVAQYIIPPIFVLGGVLGWIKRKARARKFNRISSSAITGQAIRNLSWEQFELMVGEAFRRKGFTVAETEKGADGGVDLVLTKGGEQFLVQCKQWKAAKVGVQVVRELYGVMSARGAAGGYVVTSGNFTPDAFQFAKGTSVELIDGSALTQLFKAASSEPIPTMAAPQAMVRSVSAENASPIPHSQRSIDELPHTFYQAAQQVTCPRCGGGMTPRIGKNQSGGIRDRVFFGCLAFPKCRGTRQIDEAPVNGQC